MLKIHYPRILIICLVISGIGCAHMAGPSGQEFQKMYIEAGQEHEKKGELREAYTQYKLADTVIPNSQTTTEHLKRIRSRSEQFGKSTL